MSDDALFEDDVRAALAGLPLPDEKITDSVQRHVVAAAGPPGASRYAARTATRKLVVAAAALAGVGALAGFAAGRTLAPGETTTREGGEPLSATGGPGFLPATGWTTAQTSDPMLPQAPTALAATVPLRDAPGEAPHETLAELAATDVLVQAALYGREGFRAQLDRAYPRRALPLRLADGVEQHDWEGGSGLRYVITGRVDGWLLEAIVYFGSPRPSAETRARAADQLARLILPSPCPTDPEPVDPGALPGAERAVRALLFVGVDDTATPPADYRDPSLAARVGAPVGLVPAACSTVALGRVVVVDVHFPLLRDRPELARQTYLASLQGGTWVVWARVE